MNNFLMILFTATISGSILFLLTLVLDRLISEVKISILYLLMKIAMLYFLIPCLLLTIILLNTYTSHYMETIGGADLDALFIYDNLTNITSENLFPTNPPAFDIIFVLWLVGFVVIFVFRALYKHFNLYQLLKHCVPIKNAEILEMKNLLKAEFKIKREIVLYKCKYVSTPFIAGLAKPIIIIPDIALSLEEIEIIFRHEMVHYKSNDVFFRILVGIVQGINWFNPIITLFIHRFNDFSELSCDEKVTNQLRPSQRSPYANLIIKFAEGSVSFSNVSTFSNSNENFMKRRIYTIMKGSKIKKTSVIIIVSLVVTFFCPLITFASASGVSQLQNQALRFIREKESNTETYKSQEYIEYSIKGETIRTSGEILSILPRGSNSVNFTLPAYGEAMTSSVTLDKGATIKIFVSGDHVGFTGTDIYVDYIDENGYGYSDYNPNAGCGVDIDIRGTISGTYNRYHTGTLSAQITKTTSTNSRESAIGRYYHKRVTSGLSLSFSSSGPSISVSAGYNYDQSADSAVAFWATSN